MITARGTRTFKGSVGVCEARTQRGMLMEREIAKYKPTINVEIESYKEKEALRACRLCEKRLSLQEVRE